MGRILIRIIGALLALGIAPARGETIWEWTHEASASGSAHLFDGGPVETDSVSTPHLNSAGMRMLVSDDTRPGTLGAGYSTFAESDIRISANDEIFQVRVNFDTGYFPSFFGGDTPGGEGEGSLSSVIEFVMPTDKLEWFVFLDIDVGHDFDGATSVVVENITRFETLLAMTEGNRPGEFLSLVGQTGDVIRITSMIMGGGTVPQGVVSIGEYDTELITWFTVPEPATLALLISGAVLGMLPKGRRGSIIHRKMQASLRRNA